MSRKFFILKISLTKMSFDKNLNCIFLRGVGTMNRILSRGIKLVPIVIALLVIFTNGAVLAAGPKMTLRESIDTALKNSVLIHGAQEGVKGAEAKKNEAITAFLPKFSTTYSYTRLHEQPSMTIPAIPPNPARSAAERDR